MSATGKKQTCDASRFMNIQLIAGGNFVRTAVVNR